MLTNSLVKEAPSSSRGGRRLSANSASSTTAGKSKRRPVCNKHARFQPSVRLEPLMEEDRSLAFANMSSDLKQAVGSKSAVFLTVVDEECRSSDSGFIESTMDEDQGQSQGQNNDKAAGLFANKIMHHQESIKSPQVGIYQTWSLFLFLYHLKCSKIIKQRPSLNVCLIRTLQRQEPSIKSCHITSP